MDRRGQGAVEYLTTYGWAILLVLIVGIVVWQLGLFDIQGKVPPSYKGFSVLVPSDWAVTSSGDYCTLTARFANAAGEELQSLAVLGGSACVPETLSAGGKTTCSKEIGACGRGTSSYEESMAVTYERSSDGQGFQSSGVFFGNVEG